MDYGQKEWKCPHPGCIFVVTAYSDFGLQSRKELHEDVHRREREFALGPPPPKPAKDLNVLELTVADKAFLKTRYIKVD